MMSVFKQLIMVLKSLIENRSRVLQMSFIQMQIIPLNYIENYIFHGSLHFKVNDGVDLAINLRIIVIVKKG